MLTKTYSLFNIFARRKEEAPPKELTRKQWIAGDRIIMILLFLSVIIGAIIFS